MIYSWKITTECWDFSFIVFHVKGHHPKMLLKTLCVHLWKHDYVMSIQNIFSSRWLMKLYVSSDHSCVFSCSSEFVVIFIILLSLLKPIHPSLFSLTDDFFILEKYVCREFFGMFYNTPCSYKHTSIPICCFVQNHVPSSDITSKIN